MSDLHNDTSPTVIYQRTVPAAALARIAELEAERDHWKSNHDEMVRQKRMLQDRPDLGDRAKSIRSLQARIAELEAENRLLTETGQLNVLADIREIVDPMSPGRMMQSELVERIREIVGENARLAAIEASAINLCNHWATSRRWPSDLSPFLIDLNAALAAKERA